MLNKVIAQLEADLITANAEFAEIAKEEQDGDYSDAMLSMDRTRAEGYSDGLEYALNLLKGSRP